MTSGNRISQEQMLPGYEEFFDAVRRHICQVLSFDYGLVDVVRGHEVVSFKLFTAAESDDPDSRQIELLEDEHQQPVTVAHTLVAQKVKQTKAPWIGKAFVKGDTVKGFPYAIVPIINDNDGTSQVRGLLRVISLDSKREIESKELATLKLIGQHLAERLPQFAATGPLPPEEAVGAVEQTSVLVVHSNRVTRRRISRIVGTRYQVVEADNAERTLEALQQQPIDLIVLDSEVPGASGIALCRVLKDSQQWKHIPVILMTADNNVSGKVDGLNAGAEDCLSESCHEAELLARVRASLRLRKTERDLAMQWQMLEDYAQKLEQAFESERQASVKVTKHNQSLEQLNRELQQSKLKESVLRGQDQLLHRISDIIRKSFHISENISKTLEELGGHFSLDCCFAVLPSDEEPEDAVRSEYVTEDDYKVQEDDVDLKILEIFKKHFGPEQPLVVSDMLRDRLVEPFKKEALGQYPVKSLFYVPITYEEKLLGVLGGHRCESEAIWTSENKNFLTQVAGQIAIGVTNARLYARVQRQATTDGLTGLFNHRTGQEKLSEQMRLAERYQRNIAVVMIDVDHFKSINDGYGHPAGDTVLKSVARLIRNDCRDVDIPVRYGGEEFLLILPEVNQEGAVVVAERIRRKLSKELIIHDEVEISLTASLGVAAFPEDAHTQQQLLDLSDKALYLSKRLGRNQVHTAGDLMFNDFVEGETPAPAKERVVPKPIEGPLVPPPDRAVQQQQTQEMHVVYPATPQAPPPAPAEEMTTEVVDMVKALATKLYSRSEYNKIHHLETARFAELLAKVMGLTQQQVEQIRVAGLLHDVGILSIPEEIINKPGLVSNEEMDIIAKHPELGAQLLRPIRALKDICDIVENHHECWDGTGYPRGLKGEEIPVSSRILSIVDAYHAMISDRPYRPAMTREHAKKALKNGAGTQWDPLLVDIFLAVLDSLDQQQAKQESTPPAS